MLRFPEHLEVDLMVCLVAVPVDLPASEAFVVLVGLSHLVVAALLCLVGSSGPGEVLVDPRLVVACLDRLVLEALVVVSREQACSA
jgi:hypothetical protein